MSLTLSGAGQDKPGPFVTVYRDDSVAFQVRRDRITTLGDGSYKVWLRWLWAEPQPWKSGSEASRIVVADIDCTNLRVRELASLHKDRTGKLFDVEETAPADAPWKSFAAGTGAASTMTRLCEFVPELVRTRDESAPKKE